MSLVLESAAPRRFASGSLAFALLSTLGATVLVGSEAGFVALAFDWSVSGLLHLPPIIHLPLAAVSCALATAATGWFAVNAWRYESGVIYGATQSDADNTPAEIIVQGDA